MATLYVSEFVSIAGTGNFAIAAAQVTPVAEQTITISGVSTPSAAFNANTRFVRVHCDAICSLAWGTNPTATTGKMRMAANQTEYFGIPLGNNYKVAVITNT
jgi:hypothetical protein